MERQSVDCDVSIGDYDCTVDQYNVPEVRRRRTTLLQSFSLAVYVHLGNRQQQRPLRAQALLQALRIRAAVERLRAWLQFVAPPMAPRMFEALDRSEALDGRVSRTLPKASTYFVGVSSLVA